MQRLLVLLFTGCLFLGALFVFGCSRDSPTALPPPVAEKRDQAPKPPPEPDPPPATGLTAAELLADPLLHLMLRTLRDADGAEAISGAIDDARVSLANGEAETARSHFEDASRALNRYQDRRDADDEDVIHLDAVERFLDEVERLIGTGGSKGKKKE